MALSKCPACGGPLSDTLNKCIHCGAVVKKCPECGALSKKSSELCPGCGYRLKSAEVAEAPEAEAEPLVARKSSVQRDNGDDSSVARFKEVSEAWYKTVFGRISKAVNTSVLWNSRKITRLFIMSILLLFILLVVLSSYTVNPLMAIAFLAIMLLVDAKEIIVMAFKGVAIVRLLAFFKSKNESIISVSGDGLKVLLTDMSASEKRCHLSSVNEFTTAAYLSDSILHIGLYFNTKREISAQMLKISQNC